MIVGTHFGLFMPALRPNWKQCVENGEPELQVRSRRRIDLLNLRQLMTEHALFLDEPFAIKNTDYQWRAYCTREDWGRALVIIADDIDYTKFKDTPQKKHGDHKLTDAYGAIWSATLRSFPTGSVYTRQTNRSSRVVETVYRTENREWHMKGASPRQLAELMKEIDAATDGVELPTENELRDIALHEQLQEDAEIDRQARVVDVTPSYMGIGPTEVDGHLDHSGCTHNNTSSARRKCRKRFYGPFKGNVTW